MCLRGEEKLRMGSIESRGAKFTQVPGRGPGLGGASLITEGVEFWARHIPPASGRDGNVESTAPKNNKGQCPGGAVRQTR